MTVGLSEILTGLESRRIYAKIRGDCSLRGSVQSNLPSDERAFLISELYVRTSRYGDIERDIPTDASEFAKRLARCTGYLFTAPEMALVELEYLLPRCQSQALSIRLTAWKMHLLLLLGQEKIGARVRSEIESLTTCESPWAVEIYTLLAVSYFSTGHSKRALKFHHKAMEGLGSESSDQFFRSFGAATGLRAALKICDASAFDHFSKILDESLEQSFDNRYRLRQLSYRAMVLTQLGEVEIAQKYWSEGDELLKDVDKGAATVERAQYLILRCLAASLIGNERAVEGFYKAASDELDLADMYDVHRAELEVCYQLSAVSNQRVRALNVARSFQVLSSAKARFLELYEKSQVDAVRECYLEASKFCDGILTGRSPREKPRGKDLWRTLSISIIHNYQNYSKFSEGVTYFRLIPNFIYEMDQSSFSDAGISAALTRVLNISPKLTENGFEIPFEREELSRISQISILLSFANALRDLYKKAEESSRREVLADTVAAVAHDFRRPFNLLRASLQGLLFATDPADVKELAGKALPGVLVATESVNRLLDDVTDTMRPALISRSLVKPESVIESAIESIKAARSTVRIEKSIQPDITVSADPSRLRRAIENIVENAADAAPDDRLWIKVRMEKRGTAKSSAVITVGNGSYIDRADRKRIFEKYFSKGKSSGTGLGLYISRKIMHEHGGTIRCRSSRKSGTEFDLVLPALLG